MCVARGDIILTNDHVIDKAGENVFVYPFTHKDGELVRLEKVRARVIYRSAADSASSLTRSTSSTRLWEAGS